MKITRPDDLAFPVYVQNHLHTGLSKREYIAVNIMQGLMTTLIPLDVNQLCPNNENVSYMVNLSISAADELIKELNKEK